MLRYSWALLLIVLALPVLAQSDSTDTNYNMLVRHNQVPRASARTVLPAPTFQSAKNLEDVAKKLQTALGNAGYQGLGWAYLSDEEDKPQHHLSHSDADISGFSVVTQVERMESNGTPSPAAQRHDIANPITDNSFTAEITKVLFGAPVGSYRVFLFLVTTEPKVITRQPMSQSPDENTTYLHLEKSFLMSSRVPMLQTLSKLTTGKYNPVAVAFVYEFRRSAVNGDLVFVKDSSVDAEAQLRASGIYKRLGIQ